MIAKRLRVVLALAVILAVASTLWLYQIASEPRGLNWDESIQGVEALRILNGGYLPFYPAATDHQFRFRYLAVAAIALLGRTPGALRLMNVLVGLATIPGIYLATQPVFGSRVGLLAALGFATTLWPILLYRDYVASRTLPPFYLAYFAWQAIRAWQTGRTRHWLLAGAILGAAMYSYYSILLFPLALGGWLVVAAVRRQLGRLWPGAAYGALVFGLVAAPEGLILIRFAGQALYRPGEVSVLRAGMPLGQMAGVLFSQTYQALRMFFLAGDWDPLNNRWLPGTLPPPVFPWPMAAAFLLGHWVMLRRWRSGWTFFYYLWAGVALLPTVLAVNVPSYGRASLLLTVLFVWPALGSVWLRQALARRGLAVVSLVLPAGLIGLGAMSTGRVIFLDQWYAQRWKNALLYDRPWADMAVEINQFLGQGWTGQNLIARPRQTPADRLVIVHEELWRLDLQDSVVEYLIGRDHPSVRLVPSQPTEAAPGQTVLLFWPAGSEQDPLAYLPPGREIAVHAGGWRWDVSGRQAHDPLYVAYLAAPPSLGAGPIACWRETLCLWDSTLRATDGTLQIELVWQSPPVAGFSPRVHLELRRGEQIVAQAQAPLAPEALPLAHWRPQDFIAATILLAAAAPPDSAQDRFVLTVYPSPAESAPLVPDGATSTTAGVELPWPRTGTP